MSIPVNTDIQNLESLMLSREGHQAMFKSYDNSTYVLDNNSGVYTTGQIPNLSTESVAKNRWVDYYNSILSAQVAISVTSTTTTAGAFCAGLKMGGLVQMIDTVQVSLNGTTLTQGSRLNALHSSVDILNKYSVEGLTTQGDQFYLWPDSTDSWSITDDGKASAAYTNNSVTPALPNITSPISVGGYNTGFYNRCKIAQYPATFTIKGIAVGLNPGQIRKSNFSLSGNVSTVNLYLFARLRDIHSGLFSCFDLPVKNACMQITLGLNQVSAITGVNTPGFLQGNSNPLMISSAITATNLTAASCQIAAGTNCRLYLPQVELPPAVEARLGPDAMTVRQYRDFQTQSYPGYVQPGSTINWNITSSLQGLKSVTICSFIAPTSLLPGNSVYQHFLSPEPGLPGSPLCALSNMQLNINGQSTVRNQLQFSNEIWTQVITKSRLNDGQDPIFSSSIIGQDAWARAMPGFIQFDVSRMTNDNVTPVTCQLQATNVGAFPTEVIAFLDYERTLKYEHMSGNCVVTSD